MTELHFLQIRELLNKHKIVYQHIVHEHVHHSSDAAKIRGTNLSEAAKAIILKVELKDKLPQDKFVFIQAVIPGDQRIDLKKIKNLFDSRNVQLASPDEVLEKTGCTIGSVPPFGNLFNIPIYLDESILTKEQIVFSAGTHHDSIIIKPEDYVRVVNPKVVDLRKE
ncbi:MAG: YbaK/EbsC family protein [Candidatus Woesearchaeota archaeon]